MSPTIAIAWRRVKAQRVLFALCVIYAILLAVFSKLSETRGLITPLGAIDAGFLAFGLGLLALRIIVLFIVPLIAIYRIADWLLELWAFAPRKQ